jgi:hypothetical protein
MFTIDQQHIPSKQQAPRVAPTAGIDWASTDHAVADAGGIQPGAVHHRPHRAA